MTDRNRQRLWQLVLAYEDLDADQRQLVDQALAADSALRRDWQRLQALERNAALDWANGDTEFWHTAADPVEARRSEVSLNRLLAGLPNQVPFDREVRTRRQAADRQRPWVRILLPLAAVLALIVFLPRMATENRLIGPLAVRSIALAQDGTRSLQSGAPPAEQLRTGQAFVLDLSPETSGWLVIYHVDPRGAATRIYADVTPEAAAGAVTIPPAASGDFWVLSGDGGLESFVVGASEQALPDLAVLDAGVVAGRPAAGDHKSVVVAVSSAMQEHLTDVQVLTFTHLD